MAGVEVQLGVLDAAEVVYGELGKAHVNSALRLMTDDS